MKVDIDGYFYFKNNKGDLYLMIADEDYDIVFDYIREKGVKNIMLSEMGGCSGENLDFLAEDYKFEKINIFFKKPVNLSKLSYQIELKELALSDALFDVDYNAFPKLESLQLIGQKREIKPFAEQNRLRNLEINQFLNRDLTFLQHCIHLEHLKLVNSGRLVSLSGLENIYNSLIQLEIMYCPKLVSLWKINLRSVLKRLFIENCPVLKDVSVFQNAQKLELISILKCKELESLRFIDQLPLIKEVYLERTKISDGYIPGLVQVID